jgi:hypothetical protein
VALPSNKTRAGILKESLPEKVWINSEARVASAPLGRNEELLFSCTEESFPKSGPNTPVIKNHIRTTSIAMANGLRDFTEVLADTAVGTFHTYFSEDSRLG